MNSNNETNVDTSLSEQIGNNDDDDDDNNDDNYDNSYNADFQKEEYSLGKKEEVLQELNGKTQVENMLGLLQKTGNAAFIKGSKDFKILNTGKENYPTVVFQVICKPNRLVIYCSKCFPGSCNDKTITYNDELPQAIKAGLLKDISYKIYLISFNSPAFIVFGNSSL
jgi:hypothetical protein